MQATMQALVVLLEATLVPEQAPVLVLMPERVLVQVLAALMLALVQVQELVPTLVLVPVALPLLTLLQVPVVLPLLIPLQVPVALPLLPPLQAQVPELAMLTYVII